MSSEAPLPWQETDSQQFIELGRVYTPRRDEIEATLLDLIPALPDEKFVAVEMGTGAGWLSAAVLGRFPRAHIIGLDGSPAMLQATARALTSHGDRFDLRLFRLEDPAWLEGITGVRVFLSSLVVHHLDGEGKQGLFRALYDRLEPGGALLLCDLVEPTSDPARRAMARAWDTDVKRQSLAMTGDLRAYDEFVRTDWNLYAHPDPMDIPSPLPDQLHWLTEIGYVGVDVFWLRAGHAVYGGYKPTNAA